MKNVVLLLRSGEAAAEDPPGEEASCPWEETLRAAGFEVATRAALDFEYADPETLRRPWSHPDRYAGWIFTSPRAVEAFRRALAPAASAQADRENAWKTKRMFAVGPRTAAALRSLGFEPEGGEAGSAERLARRILKTGVRGPLLFACGDRRRDALPAILREAGVSAEEIVAYRTRLRPLRAWPGGEKPDWIVFFSPSGVEAMLQSPELSMEGLSLAAIGGATADALRVRGFESRAVAEEPSPEALADALRSAH